MRACRNQWLKHKNKEKQALYLGMASGRGERFLRPVRWVCCMERKVEEGLVTVRRRKREEGNTSSAEGARASVSRCT